MVTQNTVCKYPFVKVEAIAKKMYLKALTLVYDFVFSRQDGQLLQGLPDGHQGRPNQLRHLLQLFRRQLVARQPRDGVPLPRPLQ